MEKILTVKIFTTHGCALLDDGKEWYILKEAMDAPRPARELDNLKFLLDEDIVICHDNIQLSWIKKALELEILKVRALNAALAGLSSELDAKTRELAMGVANELLISRKYENIRRFLKKNFLTKPLPAYADLMEAIKTAGRSKYYLIGQIYREKCQEKKK